MSVFGAILMYILSMAALFRLRRSAPEMPRSFMAPCFPWFPAFALVAAVICMLTMIYYNPLLAGIFVGILVVGYAGFAKLGQPVLDDAQNVAVETH